MIQTEDPLPKQGGLAARITQFFSQRISAIILVSCFFVVPIVSAQSEGDTPLVGRSSVAMTDVLCGAGAKIRASADGDSMQRNALAHAVCRTQGKSDASSAFAQRLHEYLAGYPIDQMVDSIAKQDPVVAAYMIAMAKQESNWGRRVPVLNGQDCYNYWGFRAQRERMGSGGHTCFDSPEDAVETVAKRISTLVYDYERTTPRQMLIWKCGRSCATHDPAGVERWVHVISRYYHAVTAIARESDA